jgi:hypothetical protein
MARFTLKREISLGDLLTPLSILVSLVAVLVTWQDDKESRAKQYADNIRRSCSIVSAKLERWGTLADRYFDDIQPTLISATMETAETHSVLPARRDLYRGLMEAEGKASQRIVDEQLEIAYMELYGYVPALRPPFEKIRQQITEAQKASQSRLAHDLQVKLQGSGLLKSSDSAVMGNELRMVVQVERNRLAKEIQQVTQPLSDNILKLITLSDEDLLDPKKRDAELAIFQNVSDH